jgi:multiple sugar transport system substrate-binding protein
MKVRKFVFFSSILFILVACSDQHEGPGNLVYWASSNPEEITFAENHINEWNKNHPGAVISFQPVPEGQSSEEVILAAVVGKTTPDIYSNMWQGDVEDFALAGVLIRLDTIEGFMDFLYERCDSMVIEEIRSSNGNIYQIPWKVNPIMMMVNPDMFEEAGIKPIPQTYSSYLEAGAKIISHAQSAGTGNKWLGITEVSPIWWQRFFNFLPLYYASSHGDPLVKDGKAVFNNEHGVGVFTFLQALYTRSYFPREQQKGQSDPFLAGRMASTFTGPWTIEQNERFKPEGFKYDFYPMPVPDGMTDPAFSYGDPKNIVIFSTCKEPQTAWQFLRTMLTAESDKEFLQISGQFPRRKDINTNPLFLEYLNAHPKLIPFAEQTKHLKGMDSAPYLKEVLDIISQEYEACVVYGKKTPEDAIDDAAKAVELLYIK